MTKIEIEDTFKLPGEKRLEQFVATISATKLVYGISDDEGWALLGDDKDTDILPLFQHPALADAFRQAAGFEAYDVEEFDLEMLIDWLDDLEEDGTMVAVCPNTKLEGPIVEPGQLKERF